MISQLEKRRCVYYIDTLCLPNEKTKSKDSCFIYGIELNETSEIKKHQIRFSFDEIVAALIQGQLKHKGSARFCFGENLEFSAIVMGKREIFISKNSRINKEKLEKLKVFYPTYQKI